METLIFFKKFTQKEKIAGGFRAGKAGPGTKNQDFFQPVSPGRCASASQQLNIKLWQSTPFEVCTFALEQHIKGIGNSPEQKPV